MCLCRYVRPVPHGAATPADSVAGFTSVQLYRAIAHDDKQLFDAVFTTCNLKVLDGLLAENFEFYHDRWSLIATSKAQFVSNIKNLCDRQAKGIDYCAKRVLVPGSLKVYSLHHYGAIETGVHRFYRVTPGKPDQLTETAKFFQVWKYAQGKWLLVRVFSYDHRDARASKSSNGHSGLLSLLPVSWVIVSGLLSNQSEMTD